MGGFQIKKILVPSDLTDISSTILPIAMSVAEKHGSLVHLLHVVDLRWRELHLSSSSVQQFHTEAFAGAERAMAQFCERYLQGCEDLQTSIAQGTPAVEILRAINNENIDLVVMGTHGMRGLRRAVFGSVAESVIRESPVPVLIVNTCKV